MADDTLRTEETAEQGDLPSSAVLVSATLVPDPGNKMPLADKVDPGDQREWLVAVNVQW